MLSLSAYLGVLLPKELLILGVTVIVFTLLALFSL